MVIWVADLHNEYQSGYDIQAANAAGIGAFIIKASHGATGYTAPAMFDTWISQARAAGAIPGAYHWLTSADTDNQFTHYTNRIAAVGGPEGLICALDVEDTTYPPTWDNVTGWITRWFDTYGPHPLLIYSGNWWWSTRGWDLTTIDDAITPHLHLWDSRYVSTTGTPPDLYAGVPADWWTPRYSGLDTTTLIQFASTCSIPTAYTGVFDINAYQGTAAQLAALTTQEHGMDWTEYKAGRIYATRPDWMSDADGADSTSMRMGDWLGSLPNYLTGIRNAITTLQASVDALTATVSGLATTATLTQDQADAITAAITSEVGTPVAQLLTATAAAGTALASAGGE